MNTIKLNPTKLLISDLPQAEEQKTASGIIIPGSVMSKQPSMRGKIIFTGSGTKDIPIVHSVGDIALYNPRAGQKIEWNDKEYRLVDVGEIFLSGSDI